MPSPTRRRARRCCRRACRRRRKELPVAQSSWPSLLQHSRHGIAQLAAHTFRDILTSMQQPQPGSVPGAPSSPPDIAASDLRLLVDSTSDYAIFMLDPAGHIASWNAGAQRIKGYTADEVIGRHFSMFYTDEANA